MKIKTSELTGAALDWAVDIALTGRSNMTWQACVGLWERGESASTNWAQGGPIIEKEGIDIYQSGVWVAEIDGKHTTEGPTPLIAAMRCFVASKLGDEVDVPDELTH